MMTRPHVLNCLHQPFAECFYFGPERSAERYANGMNEERRLASGFIESTYCTVMEKISNEFNKVSGPKLLILRRAQSLLSANENVLHRCICFGIRQPSGTAVPNLHICCTWSATSFSIGRIERSISISLD